jgi:hypothetical protein
MLLLDGFEGLSSSWMLICALKVPNEHGTQLAQEWMDPSGKLMRHDLVALVNAVCRNLALTQSSPPAASMMV